MLLQLEHSVGKVSKVLLTKTENDDLGLVLWVRSFLWHIVLDLLCHDVVSWYFFIKHYFHLTKKKKQHTKLSSETELCYSCSYFYSSYRKETRKGKLLLCDWVVVVIFGSSKWLAPDVYKFLIIVLIIFFICKNICRGCY